MATLDPAAAPAPDKIGTTETATPGAGAAVQQGDPGSGGAHNPAQDGATPSPATGAAGEGSGGEAGKDPAATAQVEETRARRMATQATRKLAAAEQKLAEAKTLADKAAALDGLKDEIRKTPAKVLERLGLTPEELLEAIVAEKTGQPATLTPEERLAKLEEKLEKDGKERTQVTEAEVKAEMRRAVVAIIGKDPEFDLVDALDAYDTVNEAVFKYTLRYPGLTQEQGEAAVRYFARQAQVKLEADEAARLDKLSKLPRFAKRFGAPAPAAAAPADPAKDAAAPPPKTITNAINRSGPPTEDPLPSEPEARWREVKRRAALRQPPPN